MMQFTILISCVALAGIINDSQSILSYICVTTETIIVNGLAQLHFFIFFLILKRPTPTTREERTRIYDIVQN